MRALFPLPPPLSPTHTPAFTTGRRAPLHPVSRLNLADKITATVSASAYLPSVGLPPYQWWSEGKFGAGFSPTAKNQARSKRERAT